MTTTHSVADGVEMDVKRFHLPGVVVKRTCPNCGHGCVFDFSEQYLGYPKVGPFYFDAYCHECDYEWTISMVLGITLEVKGPEDFEKEWRDGTTG